MKEEVVLSSAVNKRLLSRLMSSRPATKEEENFVLKGTKDFTVRSKNVFEELQTLEKAHDSWISNNTLVSFQDNDEVDVVKPHVESQFNSRATTTYTKPSVRSVEKRSGEGNRDDSEPFHFKKPQTNKIYRPRTNLSNKTNNRFKKWKKYSLADVPLSSNATNSAVALAFISDLRKRKNSEKDEEKGKIVFSKPKPSKSDDESMKLPSNKKIKRGLSFKIEKGEKPETSDIKLDHLETCD